MMEEKAAAAYSLGGIGTTRSHVQEGGFGDTILAVESIE